MRGSSSTTRIVLTAPPHSRARWHGRRGPGAPRRPWSLSRRRLWAGGLVDPPMPLFEPGRDPAAGPARPPASAPEGAARQREHEEDHEERPEQPEEPEAEEPEVAIPPVGVRVRVGERSRPRTRSGQVAALDQALREPQVVGVGE